MTRGRCGCLRGLPSYPHCQLPALPLRSSVPRCGGAPRGSHRNRSQGQDPRYAASVLGAHGGNLHPPSVPSGPEWGWGWGPWAQGPLGGCLLCSSLDAAGRDGKHPSQKSPTVSWVVRAPFIGTLAPRAHGGRAAVTALTLQVEAELLLESQVRQSWVSPGRWAVGRVASQAGAFVLGGAGHPESQQGLSGFPHAYCLRPWTGFSTMWPRSQAASLTPTPLSA